MNGKYKEYLKESAKHIQIADHMTYVTLPLVNDKKLILKIFEEIFKSIINLVYSALYYEFEEGNITLHKDNEKNIEIFLETIAKKYEISDKELTKIKQIWEIDKKHKKSAMEFVKENKVVMMQDDLKTPTINSEEIKEYLLLSKNIFLKISSRLKR